MRTIVSDMTVEQFKQHLLKRKKERETIEVERRPGGWRGRSGIIASKSVRLNKRRFNGKASRVWANGQS